MNEIGCPTRTTFSVTFDPLPEVDLGMDQSACDGDMVTIESLDDPTYNYEWTLDGDVLAGETSNTISVSAGGTYALNVTSDQSCMNSDMADVVFNSIPTLDVGPDAVFCEGSSVELSITTDAPNISWTLNGTNQGTNTSTISATQGGDYMIEVSSDAGCVNAGQISVEEVSNPTLALDNVELCPGESQDVSVQTGFVSYEWDGVNSTGADATIEYTSVNSVTTESISLTVTDQNNCMATESFDVTYYPELMASVVSDNFNICEGQQVTLVSTGGLFYEWTDPTGTLSATDVPNPTASPDATTTYSVTVSDNCPNNMEVFDIVVNVNAPPVADAGRDTCVLAGQIYELNASGGASYFWDNEEYIVGSAFLPNAQVQLEDSSVVFTVTVTDVNGCVDTDQVEICVVDDPTELIEEVTVITPNGDGKNDALVFRGLEAFPENKLTIFNRWGNIIYQKVGYQRDGLLWEALRDGEELPPDTYYYVLEFAEFKIKSSLTILRD